MGYRKRAPEGDAKFFAVLETGAPVSVALAASGYSRTAVYHWRKRYPRFAAAWSAASANAVERLEAEADARLRARYFAVCHRSAPAGMWIEPARELLRSRLRALRLRRVALQTNAPKGPSDDLPAVKRHRSGGTRRPVAGECIFTGRRSLDKERDLCARARGGALWSDLPPPIADAGT